jgi:hypothetical protein
MVDTLKTAVLNPIQAVSYFNPIRVLKDLKRQMVRKDPDFRLFASLPERIKKEIAINRDIEAALASIKEEFNFSGDIRYIPFYKGGSFRLEDKLRPAKILVATRFYWYPHGIFPDIDAWVDGKGLGWGCLHRRVFDVLNVVSKKHYCGGQVYDPDRFFINLSCA